MPGEEFIAKLHTPDISPQTNELLSTQVIPGCLRPIEKFDLSRIPPPRPPTRQASFNDDLVLGHFRSSPMTWADEQRKGIQFNTPHASSHADHVFQVVKEPFRLSGPIPLPGEIISSLEFLSSYSDEKIRGIWAEQFSRLSGLISAAAPTQEAWNSSAPSLRPVAGSIKTVALSFLMDSMGLGGSRWIRQFIYGFDVIGSFSQSSVLPLNIRASFPLDPEIFGFGRAARFSSRARASGSPPMLATCGARRLHRWPAAGSRPPSFRRGRKPLGLGFRPGQRGFQIPGHP